MTINDLLYMAECGIKVFPLAKGGKVPHSKSEHPDAQKANATVDEAQIREWWDRFPGCNWGGLLPPTMVVIDVDLTDTGAKNLWASDPEIAEELAEAFLVVGSASGGDHHYFSQPQPGRWGGVNGPAKNGVDVRSGDSFYIVLPGCEAETKHPTVTGPGLKPYRIKAGKMVEAFDMTPPGPAISRFLDRYCGAGGKAPTDSQQSIDFVHVAETVCMDNFYDFVNTSKTFQKLALRLFMEFEGVEKFSLGGDGVIRFQRPGSRQPWGATWNTKESRHGASGKASNPLGYPRLYAWSPNWTLVSTHKSDGSGRVGYSALDLINLYLQDDLVRHSAVMLEAEREWMEISAALDEEEAAQADTIDHDDLPLEIGEDDGPPPDMDMDDDEWPPPDLDEDEDEYEYEDGAEAPAPKAEPKPPSAAESIGDIEIDQNEGDQARRHCRLALEIWEGMRPGGIMRGLWDEAARTEFRPQPIFRMAAAIVGMAALIGRKITTPCGQMSNLVILCTASSGGGKENPKNVLANLLDNIRPDGTQTGNARSVIRCGVPHSGSGLYNTLASAHTRLLLWDELGTALEAGAAGGNGHQASMLGFITELFTNGTGIMQAREKADQLSTPNPLRAPYLSIIGFTQTVKMDTIISVNNIETGLVPRILFFHGMKFSKLRRAMSNVVMDAMPEELVKQAKAWQELNPDAIRGSVARGNVHFIPWKFDEEAAEYLDGALTNLYEKLLKKANKDDALESACFTRAIQSIKKLAMVFAADRVTNPKSAVEVVNKEGNTELSYNIVSFTISKKDVELAEKVFNASLNVLVEHIETGMTASEYGAVYKKICSYLRGVRDGGSDRWVTPTEIIRVARSRILDKPAESRSILSHLVSEGILEDSKINRHGKEAFLYRHGLKK